MRKYFFIGIGGAVGAILRYTIKNIRMDRFTLKIPVNTLIINVTGTFLLALILTAAIEILEMDEDIRLGIATGFLGAYTTFSTLCKETATLLQQGLYFTAASYILLSTLLGLLFAYLGIIVARACILKTFKNHSSGIPEGEVVSDIEETKQGRSEQ